MSVIMRQMGGAMERVLRIVAFWLAFFGVFRVDPVLAIFLLLLLDAEFAFFALFNTVAHGMS